MDLNSGATKQIKMAKKLLTAKLPLSSGYLLLNFSNTPRLMPSLLSLSASMPPNIEVPLDLEPTKCPWHLVGHQSVLPRPGYPGRPQPAEPVRVDGSEELCRAGHCGALVEQAGL